MAVHLWPLRQDGDELERRAATTTLPNGVSHDVGVSHGRGPFEAVNLSAGSGLVAEPQVEQRETPLVGAVLPEPELPADAPGRSEPERRNAGRRHGPAAANLPLFPRFVPSPLPGQSPVEHHRDDHRNQSWFSRIGDYIQRRVEVTSWASPPAVADRHAGIWHGQTETQTVMVSTPRARESERRPESTSSGSAAVAQEVVQAEVARQLEAAMGDLTAKLQYEKGCASNSKDMNNGCRRRLLWRLKLRLA